MATPQQYRRRCPTYPAYGGTPWLMTTPEEGRLPATFRYGLVGGECSWMKRPPWPQGTAPVQSVKQARVQSLLEEDVGGEGGLHHFLKYSSGGLNARVG